MTPEQVAQRFHEAYERLAPSHGYETRTESAKPWSEVPERNRNLMIATCAEVLKTLGLEKLEKERDEARAQLGLEVARTSAEFGARRKAQDILEEIQKERDELQALFDLQRTRVLAAIKRWQEATGEFMVHPDLGKLVQWLLDGRDFVERENAELLKQMTIVREHALTVMKLYPQGSEESRAMSALFAKAAPSSRTPSALYEELLKLKEAVRTHARQLDDDRCWLDDQQLYATAGVDCEDAALPPKDEFLANCARYHASRQSGQPYTTVVEKMNKLLDKVLGIVRDQPYASDTKVGLRQQWVKDEIAKKVVALKEKA